MEFGACLWEGRDLRRSLPAYTILYDSGTLEIARAPGGPGPSVLVV